MLKQRREAVERVAAEFRAAEAAIDESTRKAAACLSTILDQRAAANLPLATGLKAIELMSEVSALLIRARQLSLDVHGELARIPDEIGIRSFGDTSPCPPAAEVTGAEPKVTPLRIVA